MASPTDELAQAIEDVERLARELYEGYRGEDGRILEAPPWEGVPPRERDLHRAVVRRLLHNDVIRVGQRPSVERPLEGQTTIDSLPLDG